MISAIGAVHIRQRFSRPGLSTVTRLSAWLQLKPSSCSSRALKKAINDSWIQPMPHLSFDVFIHLQRVTPKPGRGQGSCASLVSNSARVASASLPITNATFLRNAVRKTYIRLEVMKQASFVERLARESETSGRLRSPTPPF